MAFLGELRVDAVHENLRTISHFVHGIAHRLSLSDRVQFELELAVEEAATNIITHAYSPDLQGPILISAQEDGDQVEVTLTDWGEPFNPADARPFDLSAPIETRIQGGMGLHFINTLMDQVTRTTGTRPGEANTITLAKRIERAVPGQRMPSAMQELNAMRTVSEVMTSNIALDDLLELIVSKLVTTINTERGTLYLVDEEHGELWSRVLMEGDSPLTEIRLKIGEGIAGYVAATGETLNIEDAYSDPRFNGSFDRISGFRTRSMLTAPMFNPQQKIIGVVQLLNKRDGPFTTRDERLLAAMTSQAAISIENARLYQQELEQQILNRELETAHSIQASFLPAKIPQPPGWELGAFWRPIRNVAGDFYDFYRVGEGQIGVVIADVSGKGIPAALFMALSVTVLRFGMSLALPPGEVTRRANELIIADQRSKMFATTFTGYLSLDTGELRFASAGHNPALIYRAATGECDYVTAPGVAIGIFKGATFGENVVQLAPGDILVLYTDGITEATDDMEEEFGEERLEVLVAAHAQDSAQGLIEAVFRAITEFAGESNLFDDATLVVVKRAAG